MSEAEAIEALSDVAANAGTFFTIFLSVTFAYLTVAYVVGAALSTDIAGAVHVRRR